MESHAAEYFYISENNNIDRVEKAIRLGKSRKATFSAARWSRHSNIRHGREHQRPLHEKVGEGAPVRFIAAEITAEAAAVREVDLQKRFHSISHGTGDSAEAYHSQIPCLEAKAPHRTRTHACTFTFGKSKHPMFSDNAATRMRRQWERSPSS